MNDGRWLTFAALAALTVAGQVRRGSAARRRKPVGRHPLSWAPPEKELVGTTEQGDPIFRTKKRKRGGGVPVNPYMPMPKAPGPWVDLDRCSVCGMTYQAFNSGVTFAQGAAKIRQLAGAQGGGGWRTPGAVLYALKTIKAERWYLRHFACGAQAHAHQRYQRQHNRWQEQMQEWRQRHPDYADPQASVGAWELDPPPVEPEDPTWPAPGQQRVPF